MVGRLLRKRPGLFRRPDAGIDRRSCGASIGAKKVAGRMYPFGPKGPGAAVPGPSLFCRNDSRFVLKFCVGRCVAMSRDRAARYRRLALKEPDKEKAELLRLLADEADRGVLVTTEWLSARPYKKVEISEAGDK